MKAPCDGTPTGGRCVLDFDHKGDHVFTPEAILDAGIKYLRAVQVAPGHYAYQLKVSFGRNETHAYPYRVVGEEYVIELGKEAIREPRSLWYSIVSLHSAEMPPWWTPECQTAFRYVGTKDPSLTGVTTNWDEVPAFSRPTRITVDLFTGHEIVLDSDEDPGSDDYCATNDCERPECHRCFPVAGCRDHEKCREARSEAEA